MEVASAHYEACEVVQARLDAQRNGAVVEGQARRSWDRLGCTQDRLSPSWDHSFWEGK